ncbi:MAG: hypothetical protein GY757_51040 [bacterium]|nr:hypothetical protein [bacterium]
MDNLDGLQEEHPPDSRKYRVDVIMNLLYCQKGVCAYTEMLIIDPSSWSKDSWLNGRYKEKKVEELGSLEHFDPALKKKKFWDWDNLFFIHPKINVIKRNNEVDYILKPDLQGYDPFELLEYNLYTHLFGPRTGLRDKGKKKRIEAMIALLQLNHRTVCYDRRTFITELLCKLGVGREYKIDRYFTASEMALKRKIEI